MSAVNSLPDAKAALQKKIEEYSQFQGLTLIPVILPYVLNRGPVMPGREVYVAVFRLGMVVFGITCFLIMRAKISRMKAELARLENPPSETEQHPPIPVP